jgi:hypothetical protein
MRRLIGKLAWLAAIVYVLLAVGGIVALMRDIPAAPLAYALLLMPGLAFGPAAVDAVQLHRTADPAQTDQLWRRCALYTGIGFFALVSDARLINQMGS